MSKTIRFFSLALAFVVAGCGSDGGNEPTPSIAVSLGGTVTVIQGQTGTTQVTVSRGGGFSGAVTLTATALPVGVTAAFDPATIPAGQGNGTSTLTLTAGVNAPTGAGTFTVAATGGANLNATANGSVTIQPKQDFSLNVTPNAVAIDQGSSGVLNVAITRTGGFVGAVNLSVPNLPTGVTAAFDNAAPTGNTAVLTLTAAANAALGPVNLTVSGTGDPGTRTAQFTMTIQTPPGSFTLAANPTTVSVAQGANSQTTVTVSKTGSFTGAVALTVTGLPSGVTASFNPASPSAGEASQDVQTTSVLTLTAAAGATVGSSPIVIHGNAQGQTEKTVNLTLNVTAAATGGYTLSTDPDELSIAQGANAQTTVTISKTGTFAGNVTLSVTGLPAGATATFTPPAASPRAEGTQDVQTTSTLQITVGALVEAKTYPLVIHGAAEGLAERTNFVDLIVTPSSFSIALNPTSLSIQAGANGQTTVTITKVGAFNQNVGLAVTNLPVGITAAFNPVVASAGKSPAKSSSNSTDAQTQSVLTLTVANTVTPQEYSLNVRGIREGLPNSDATLTLTVTPAPGSYTLEANPSSLNIQQGQSGQSTIQIKKTGSFTGNVTLSVTGLPAGVTASFNPTSASPRRMASASATRDVTTESVLTLNVGGSVATTAFPLVIHGAAQGQDEKTVNLTLTVQPPPGPGNASIKFCDLTDLPIWFAYKDGNGPWTQVTGVVFSDGTKYTYNIAQATGAIAWVTGSASAGYQTSVTYSTQLELTDNNGQCPTGPATRTLNGSVAGVALTDQLTITMGGSSASTVGATPNFQLQRVLDGPADLLAVRGSFVSSFIPLGYILRRGVDIANNGTIPVLDFGAAEAFAPVVTSITVTGAGTDNLAASMNYRTPTTTGSLAFKSNATSPVTLFGIPAGKQALNDLHELTAIASTPFGDVRGHLMWYKALADKTINLGAGLTAPTISNLGNAPYPRLQSTGTIQAVYDDAFSFSASQAAGAAADDRFWFIVAHRGYFAGGTYTMAIEDLTGAGYQAAWALKVGVQTNLQTAASGFSNNGVTNPMVEGGFADFASKVGQITP